MNLSYFLYHENNYLKPYVPQEDYFVNNGGIFIVADGITHDLINGVYPDPSDSYLVAKMASKLILKFLKNNFDSIEDIKSAYREANKKITKFQKNRELYKNKEKNNYTFGATVIAAAIIKNNKLYYGVLDDCSVAVFGNDGVDRLKLIPYVDNSTKYLLEKYSWDKMEGRKFWRKNIRNHQIKIGSKSYGYGVLDGHGDYEPFLQIGEINIKSGDLICVYSDGFIKPLEDKEFVAKSRKMTGSMKDLEFIAGYLREKEVNKEKSGYFIDNRPKYPALSAKRLDEGQ